MTTQLHFVSSLKPSGHPIYLAEPLTSSYSDSLTKVPFAFQIYRSARRNGCGLESDE